MVTSAIHHRGLAASEGSLDRVRRDRLLVSGAVAVLAADSRTAMEHDSESAHAWPALSLLIGLYALQGVPFALISGTLPTLFAARVSDTRIGILSVAAWPYAFKAFMAPLVDAYFSKRAWVVPCTLASGAIWFMLAGRIESLVADEAMVPLAAGLFVVVALLAIQDVAVDAWALELLPRQYLPYATVCQTVGMGAGNLLAHPILLL